MLVRLLTRSLKSLINMVKLGGVWLPELSGLLIAQQVFHQRLKILLFVT